MAIADDRRVMFMPECEVLAHTGRSLIVAGSLSERFGGSISFAGSGRYSKLIRETGFEFCRTKGSFRTIATEFFTGRRPLYKIPSLFRELLSLYREIVLEEVDLLKSLKPDLVIGDGRPSASISAEICGLPCILITNVCSSAGVLPYHTIKQSLPLTSPLFTKFPWLRPVNRLPEKAQKLLLSNHLFRLDSLLRVKFHNRLRTSFGLEPWKDFRDTLKTSKVILADMKGFNPIDALPEKYHFVGPLVWEPDMDLPEPLKDQKDFIYITMGSTGNPGIFFSLIEAFCQMPEFQVVLATGDIVSMEEIGPLPPNVRAYKFLPGIEMAKRSRLIICQGGLGTIYQALSEGVPIIGIPFLPDQEVYGIDRVEALGAGSKIHLFEITPERIISEVNKIFNREDYQRAAQEISTLFTLNEGPNNAAELIIKELFAGNG